MSPGTAFPSIDYVSYFQNLISIQEKAIVSFKRWAGGFVLIGLAVISFAIALNAWLQGVASQIIAIGGLFVGGMAAFPYREIAPRRSRIVTFILLKNGFEEFPRLSDEDRKRLRDLADETIKRQI
jgi:hypothetical protein